MAVDGENRVIRVAFAGPRPPSELIAGLPADLGPWRSDSTRLVPVIEQLAAYFSKQRQAFDLALHPQGTTFQRAVWAQLQAIPYGCCSSYGDIAQALGKPGASRAVGLANNRNPIVIVIPCHRVIGADGRMVGFGGGMETKLALLRHEGYFMF